MMTLIIPLWALDIGASAFWIGMAIAMRGPGHVFLHSDRRDMTASVPGA